MLIMCIGRRELGKTTFAVRLSRDFDKRVFFDPRNMIHTSDVILTDNQITGVLYEMIDTQNEIVIQPSFEVEKSFYDTCEEIFAWLKDNPGKKFCFLFDESRFVKNPEQNRYFDSIVRCMPSADVAVIITAHGVPDINTHLRRIADYWILFQLTLEADIDTVRERCGNEVANEVQKLKPYEYIVWDDGRRRWRKETNSQKWFVQINERIAA
jgi:hypothetical protein